ncbi:MAG: MBL fold metallo-hydrolase [Oceanobacter sp.]
MLDIRIIPVTAFMQNCTILCCEKTRECAIVDPGGDIDKVLAALESLKGKATKILLTHAHIDHCGATSELSKRLDLPVEGPHKGDDFWIQGLPQQSAMFGFPNVEIFTPDRWLEQGDKVQVGEVELNVIHCPGHTPGHVVFHQPEQKLALVGDVLFQGAIGRTDFPMGDHGQLVEAIRHRLFPLGDDVEFIPGHGPNSTFGHERRNNPYVGDGR